LRHLATPLKRGVNESVVEGCLSYIPAQGAHVTFGQMHFSLTPCFSGVFSAAIANFNRFSGLYSLETAEAVLNLLATFSIPLKRGVNESVVEGCLSYIPAQVLYTFTLDTIPAESHSPTQPK